MSRPEPGYPAPEGYEHMAAVDDRWRLASGKRCRRAAHGHHACGRPSAAELNRGSQARPNNWWAYCEDHMYGRWIENGQVMHWILREKPEATP